VIEPLPVVMSNTRVSWEQPPQNVYLLPQYPNLSLERCPRPK
jgi:hypothetical protein